MYLRGRSCCLRAGRQHGSHGAMPTVGVVLLLVGACAVVVVVLLTGDPRGQRGSGLSKDYSYDTSRYAQVDPALVWYQETAPLRPGFETLRAVAVGPDDRVYLAGDTALRWFDLKGKRLGELPLEGEPLCLAVRSDSTLFVGFLRRVEVYSAAGKRTAAWTVRGKKPHITSVAVDRDKVAVADGGDRIVLLYTERGEFLREIGRRDPDRNIPGFMIPSPFMDLAFARDGLLRVANTGRHLIEAYTLQGDREFAWGKPGARVDRFCGCCNPAHFALTPQGEFVTVEKGIVRVKLYSAEGRFKCVVAPPSVFSGALSGHDVAVDSRGRILVVDPARKVLRAFVRKGKGGTR